MGNPDQGLAQTFLGIERTAQSCDVSPKTIKRWLAHGLPHFQEAPRTKILICPNDIEQFLTRQQMAKPSLDALAEETLKELNSKKREPKKREKNETYSRRVG